MIRGLFSLVLVLALLGGGAAALAQSDTGEIDIVVQNSTGNAPVVLARVLLDGPVITSEFTPDNGKVRFTEVPDGIYRARVFARGGSPVLIVWPDLPRLRPEHAAAALGDLEAGCDVVLGPAIDGGFYLIALQRPLPTHNRLPTMVRAI